MSRYSDFEESPEIEPPIFLGDRIVVEGRLESSSAPVSSSNSMEVRLSIDRESQRGPASTRINVDTIEVRSVGDLAVTVHSAGFPNASPDLFELPVHPAWFTYHCRDANCDPWVVYVGQRVPIRGRSLREIVGDCVDVPAPCISRDRELIAILPEPTVRVLGRTAKVLSHADHEIAIAVPPISGFAAIGESAIEVEFLGVTAPCIPGSVPCDDHTFFEFVGWDYLEPSIRGHEDSMAVELGSFRDSAGTFYNTLQVPERFFVEAVLESRNDAIILGSPDGIARDWYRLGVSYLATANAVPVILRVESQAGFSLQLSPRFRWNRNESRIYAESWSTGSRLTCRGKEIDFRFPQDDRPGRRSIAIQLSRGESYGLLVESAVPLGGLALYEVTMEHGTPPIAPDAQEDDDYCGTANDLSNISQNLTIDSEYDADWFRFSMNDSAFVDFTPMSEVPDAVRVLIVQDAIPDSFPVVAQFPLGDNPPPLLREGNYFAIAVGVGVPSPYTVSYELDAAGQLGFLNQPATVGGGDTLPPVSVAFQTVSRQTVETDRAAVTVEVVSPSGAVIRSHVQNPTDGIATFADIVVNMADSGYTLVASAPGVLPAVSQPFVIVPGSAARLVLAPSGTTLRAVGATQQFDVVGAFDRGGNPVAIPQSPVTWATLNDRVATVDQNGLSMGLNTGQVAVQATADAAVGHALLTVVPGGTGANTWSIAAAGLPTIRAMWGSSATDIWAVGGAGSTFSLGPLPITADIFHYDGTAWLPDPFRARLDSIGADRQLHDVWGSAPNDVWAVGENGLIIHFTGSWTHPSRGNPVFNRHRLNGVWGSSAADVWIVGASGTILHYDGATIVGQPLWNTVPSLTTAELTAVWGSGATDVWAVGRGGLILHSTGSDGAWSPVQGPSSEDLSDVWGSGPNDVWAVGANGTILHYNGVAWNAESSPIASSLNSVSGNGPNDVWAVGDGGGVIHRNDGRWSAVTTQTTSDLRSIWGVTTDDVWIGGDHEAGAREGVLARYDGAAWEMIRSVAGTRTLRSVWGFAPDDVWVVGDSGEVGHFDGNSWLSVTGGTSASLSDVWGSAADDIWAVGSDGVVLHYGGVEWAGVPSPTTDSLLAIWGSKADDIWVAGRNTILHYDGVDWRLVSDSARVGPMWGSGPSDIWAIDWRYDGFVWRRQPGVSTATRGMWGTAMDDVWAVGRDIRRFDGTSWRGIGNVLPFPGNWNGVWGTSPDDVWVGGYGPAAARLDAAIMHYDGVSWSGVNLPVGDLIDIWGASGDEVWAVGENGVIVHARPNE